MNRRKAKQGNTDLCPCGGFKYKCDKFGHIKTKAWEKQVLFELDLIYDFKSREEAERHLIQCKEDVEHLTNLLSLDLGKENNLNGA